MSEQSSSTVSEVQLQVSEVDAIETRLAQAIGRQCIPLPVGSMTIDIPKVPLPGALDEHPLTRRQQIRREVARCLRTLAERLWPWRDAEGEA